MAKPPPSRGPRRLGAKRPGGARPPGGAEGVEAGATKRPRPPRKAGSTRVRADGTAASEPRKSRGKVAETRRADATAQGAKRTRPPRQAGSVRVRADGTAAAAPREEHKAGEPQRIVKLLARAGIASRREIERMIADRRIALDGLPVETPATILTTLAGVSVDGKPVRAAAETRLFLFHKPTGLITAERDPAGRPTIYDRIPKDLPRLMPVGRLDLNTEGLLLLTNDGEFKRQLELPRTGVERVYRARVFGEVSQDRLEELIAGVEVEGVRYGPIDANLERRTGRNAWLEMKLSEGKNREVRRVLEHLGLQVSRLIRLAYGPFVLGDLPAGAVGEVRQHDLAEFRKGLR